MTDCPERKQRTQKQYIQEHIFDSDDEEDPEAEVWNYIDDWWDQLDDEEPDQVYNMEQKNDDEKSDDQEPGQVDDPFGYNYSDLGYNYSSEYTSESRSEYSETPNPTLYFQERSQSKRRNIYTKHSRTRKYRTNSRKSLKLYVCKRYK